MLPSKCPFCASENRVAKIMQKEGLSANRKRAFRPKTTVQDSESASRIAPNILAQSGKPKGPGEALVTFVGAEPNLDTGYAVHMAREKGVKTIAVTSSGVALPARKADLTVIVPGKSPIGIPTFGALMQVASLIWEAVMKERVEAAGQKMEDLQVNMEALLQLRAATPEYEVATAAE